MKKENHKFTKFGAFLVGAVIVVSGLATIWEKWFKDKIDIIRYSLIVVAIILILLIGYVCIAYRKEIKKFCNGLKYIPHLEGMYKEFKRRKNGKKR